MTERFLYPGTDQILADRRALLADYDRAREQSRSHKVETYHGNAGEAFFRSWLERFLPRRYGITPGYVVSQVPLTGKLPHFDVIIYDQLESPIIWIEDDPDRSSTGSSRAIPVEFVRGIIEVKAALTTKTARAAIEHLAELKPYLVSYDTPNERYRKFFSPNFFSFVVFIELRKDDAESSEILSTLVEGFDQYGYRGSVILRGEGLQADATGRFEGLVGSPDDLRKLADQRRHMLEGFAFSEHREGEPDQSLIGILNWQPIFFSQFAFDLVALLNGTYTTGRLSSFYGVGLAK